MRSFHRLSLVLSIFFLSYSSTQAEHLMSPRHRCADKRNSALDKRDNNVPFTYFRDGQGACGGSIDSDNDFIVALNDAEYEGGAHCFEKIMITVNGKTAVAQITDKCAGCLPGGLDLSQGLFLYFAPLSEGQLYGTWSYISDITTSSSPAPSFSYTPSSSPATTMPSASPSSTVSSTITSSVSTSTSSMSSVPTSTPQDPQTLTQINLALLELSVLLQESLKLDG